MIKNSDSLKAKVSVLSKKRNIPNKYVIQNYMFESLLKRLALSKYKDQFIIKGGFLLSFIFGVDLRSTMDMDTTLKGVNLNRESLEKILNEIIKIDVNDNIKMELQNIKDIRQDDIYSGYNVNIKANFDNMKINIMLDVTTGDVITNGEIKYPYVTLFEKEVIPIMAYNFETIIAEKYESILSRNIDNTRMKDYYDIYMFVEFKWREIDKDVLIKAIKNTSKRRSTKDYIENSKIYINEIEKDTQVRKRWKNYQKNYIYAKDISFESVIVALKVISDLY